jgi:hypothetical protein
MTTEAEKLFTIQSDYNYCIFTGLSEMGSQIFAAHGIDDLFVVVNFSEQGDMLRYEEILQTEVDEILLYSPVKTDAKYMEKAIPAMKRLGITKPQSIQVKKFLIPEHLIGIRQYQDSFQRFLDVPEYSLEEIEALKPLKKDYIVFSEDDLAPLSPEEETDERDSFERWIASGDFVLWCQNDFWCNSDGIIHSS